MKDQFGREINYARISVTDRCNLRCRYCMPECGVKKIPHAEILTLEEVLHVAKIFERLGIDKTARGESFSLETLAILANELKNTCKTEI